MTDDRDIRAYLLGQSSTDEAAARLEELLLDDQEMFDRVCSVETDLFDDHARGRLDAEERRLFIERYGEQGDRVRFARALARRVGDEPARADEHRVVPGRSSFAWRYWVPLAAAATLVLATGGLMRMRQPAMLHAPAAVEAPSSTAVPPVVASIVLGTSRAASTAVLITLPASAPALELRVRLDPADRFERYALELRSASNVVVWRSADLPPSGGSGALVVVGSVPAGALSDGAFELAVRGRGGDGSTEDLGFVSITVSRVP